MGLHRKAFDYRLDDIMTVLRPGYQKKKASDIGFAGMSLQIPVTTEMHVTVARHRTCQWAMPVKVK
jgi:hypothetical protein